MSEVFERILRSFQKALAIAVDQPLPGEYQQAGGDHSNLCDTNLKAADCWRRFVRRSRIERHPRHGEYGDQCQPPGPRADWLRSVVKTFWLPVSLQRDYSCGTKPNERGY